MKKYLKRYRHLTSLLAVILLAIATVHLGAPLGVGIATVGLWQLSQFAMSKPRRGVCYIATLTPEQVDEFQDILRDLKADAPNVRKTKEKVETLEKLYDEMRNEIRKLRKAGLGGTGTGVRWMGDQPYVTDDCANWLTSFFVFDVSRMEGGLERAIPDASARQRILAYAKSNLGFQQRAGGVEGTADVPLPTIYMPQIVELVFAYGAARRYATSFPLGAGTVKLPRLQAGEDNFGYLGAGTAGISQTVP